MPRTPLARFCLVVLTAGAGLALGVVVLAPAVLGLVRAGDVDEPEDLGQLEELSQNSLVYARDGSLLAVLHAEENRSPVSLEQVPQHVVDAILDVEDDRFWVHGGVDIRATLRALFTNVQAGSVRQGGSTITQQLVKNALLTPEKSVDRKVREAVLAMRLEDRLSKREILERYLNIVYFGNGAYGVQAAAETYFNADVGDLTTGQAALLAGIIRNPVGYDPVRRPELARARRDFALNRMVSNGHLTQEDADALREQPVPTQVFAPLPPPDDYFVEEVKQRLLDDQRLGETAQERYNAVFRGGLRIHTTLDPRLQAAAQAHRDRILPGSLTKGRFTSALVTVEPGTGYVRAMVAGDNFGTAKYNLATGRGGSGRQPGSSFKPIVLLAAFETGHGPHDSIDGIGPCTLKVPGFAPYTPGNYEGQGGGIMTLTQATARSINCAFARLGANVGLHKVVDVAGRLGFAESRLDPFPSISLGAEEVTPLEMAVAYATIANDGVYQPPRFVQRVLDRNGEVLFEGVERGRRAVSVHHARMATQVLRSVVEGGTGTRARLSGREVAGKTGTSQNHENAWFVGYTPQLATAVWMGSPVGNVPMRNVGGIKVTGGSYPARVWKAYMEEALQHLPAVSFTDPDPKLVPKAKFIRDKYSVVKHLPTTSTSSSTSSTIPGLPTSTPPEPTTTTTAEPASTTTVPSTTTTTHKPKP